MNLTGKIINSRYKINDLIAQGAISYIYRAWDTKDKKTVAIKILQNDHTSNKIENIVRFRTEVRAVAKLDHPNIIKIYDVGEFIGLHYLVMEYVEGTCLSQVFDNHDLPLEKSIEIIIHVCKALEFLHRRKIIHREIKPSNILIPSGSEPVKLIDFGIANVKEFSEYMKPDEIAEAFGHISAEQSGIIKRTIDGRSDLYSLGVLLYRLLTKKFPFCGNGLSSFVHCQMTSLPKKCSSINGEVSAILDSIVLKLLEKEPDKRYQSAKGLLVDLELLMQGKSEFIPGLHDTEVQLCYRTELIGREKEINSLKACFDSASLNTGAVCLIKGEAGTGKTRLVEELKEYVVSQGGLFLDGKCYEGENKEPFAPFKEIINKYVNSYYSYGEERKKKIREDLGEEFSVLGRIITNLNPSMKDILGYCPELPQLHSTRANERFYMTVARFLSRISSHEKCLVLVVDDLQGADEGTLYLLSELVRNFVHVSILVVGIYRKEELHVKPGLKKFITTLGGSEVPFEEIDLGFFNEKELSQFVAGMLFEEERSVDEVAQFIFSKSKGNPFFSIIILRQLINEKILQYRDNHWQASFSDLEKIEIPDSMVDTIIEKFYFLTEEDCQILSYAAVIGEDIELKLLFQLSDLDSATLVNIVDKAMALQVLETTGNEKEKIRFVHDRIREAFYEAIEPEKKKELHLSIAATMEQVYENNLEDIVFSLARHFIEGGDDEKSAKYAFPAAIQAKDNYANEDAIRYFEKVLHIVTKSDICDDSLLLMCKEQIGEIYLTIGEYDSAINIFHEILSLVVDDVRKSFVNMQLANALYRKSEWYDAEIFASRGLSLLNEKLPLKKHQVVTGILKELAVHLLTRLYIRKKKSSNNQKYKMITSFYESLSMVYAVSDTLKFFRANLREMNLSYFFLGETKEFATGLYGFGAICMYNGLFSLAHDYLSRSIAIHDSLGHAWGKARALEIMGYKHEFQGKFIQGKKYLEQAYDIFNRLGDLKEMSFALNGIEHYYYFTSDYSKAKEVNDQFYNLALKVQDYYHITASYLYYAQIYRELGELEKSLSYGKKGYELSVEHEIWFNACTSSIELGCTSLALGDTTAAIEYLEEACSLQENNYFPKQYVICVYHNLAQAYVDDYLKREHLFSRKEYRIYRKNIRRAGDLAVRKTRKWKTYYGSALRVQANCYSVIRKEKKANKKYLSSIELCEKRGRTFEHARSLYEYGLFLAQWVNKNEAESFFELAYTIFSDIGAGLYRDQLEHFLGIKRKERDQPSTRKLLNKERLKVINCFLDEVRRVSGEKKIFRMIIEKAVELSGARQGYLFIKNVETDGLEVRSLKFTEGYEKKYSREIVETVVETGKHIIAANAEYDTEKIKSPTNVFPKGKSILCVPLQLREEVFGACYLSHPFADGIFTEENIELLNSFFSRVSVEFERIINNQQVEMKHEKRKTARIVTDSIRGKIEKTILYIQKDDNYLSDISREGLAAYVDINPDNLGKAFKLHTGMRISEYINDLRIKYASERLVDSDDTILDIAYEAGFESISTFRRAFLKKMDVSPNIYRQKKGKL